MERIQYQLDNGIDVILQPMASAPVVACNVWVGVGSADEEPDEAGLAHVHEHMLFKGTDDREVGEIARDVESAGGRINAFTSFDQTCYYVVLSSRFFDDALDILADAVGHSSFDADELDNELEVIHEEIKRGEDNPSRVSSKLLFENAFTTHPYRLPVIGTAESVASFEREDVVAFYDKHYVPQNLALVVAGDFDVDDAKERIDDYFGDFSGPDYTPVDRPEEPPQDGPRVATDDRQTGQHHLRVGFHIPDARHEDVPAIDLLSVILGYGDASHLQRTLKRNEELAHKIFASAYTPREPGLLVLGANFSNAGDDANTAPTNVLRRLLEETFRFRHAPPEAPALDRAKTLLESQEIYGKQTIEGLAMKTGRYLMVTGDPDFEQQYYRALRAVEPADIQRVARRYLTVDNATIVDVGPDDESPVDEDELVDVARRAADTAESDQTDGPGPSATSTGSPGDDGVTRHDVPGGPTLVIQQDPSVETFSIRALTHGGTRYERDEIAGLHKLLSRLLTRGTPSRSTLDIAGDIESMAANIKGLSGRNSFGLGVTGLTRFFDRCFDIFADCMLNADIPSSEFERERRMQIQKISARRDRLGAVNYDQFTRAFFAPHPYSLPVVGTEQTLEALDADQARSIVGQRQNPRQMVLSVVGDVPVDRVVDRVEESFTADRSGPGSSPDIPEFHQRDEPGLVLGDLDKEQAHVIVGFPAPLITSDERYALDVLYAVLSGQGGRLFYDLRDQQSLAYSVYARRIIGLDASAFSIHIATSPDKIGRGVEGIRRQIRRLRNKGISDDELDRARRYLIGNHDIGLQKNASRAMKFGLNELYGLGYRRVFDYSDLVEDVTADDVQQVVDRWLDPDRMVASITSPPDTDVDPDELGFELIEVDEPTP